jgi:catalase
LRQQFQFFRHCRPLGPRSSGNLVRASIDRRDDWKQPGILYTQLTERDRADLISNLVGELGNCDRAIQERAVAHIARCHLEYGQEVAAGLGIDIHTIDTDTLTKVG